MRIMLYISSLGAGGAERVMSVLADELHYRGHEVILVNNFMYQGENGSYDVNPDIKHIYLRKDNGGNRIVKNVILVNKIRKAVMKERPDVILSFLSEPNIRMLFATSGIRVRRYVSIRSDPNILYGNEKRKKSLINWIYEKADGVIFQTSVAKEYFSTAVQEKSMVILNPIDKSFFNANWNNCGKDIVTMGRLEKGKNHRLLIDSFAEIAEDYPDENLVIYGEGAMRGELQALIAGYGLEKRILLPGAIRDVANALASAKLFVLSSDSEGLPNALMEALAMGVPCISTDCPCGGPRDLIENGINGMLVPVGDCHGLANCMRKLLNDGELRDRLGKAAKLRAREFQTESIIEQWEDFLFSND